MSSVQSTAKQVALLERFGLFIPPSRQACRRLISYILRGNGTEPITVPERVALIKAAQDEWAGRKVKVAPGHGSPGEVICVIPLLADEVDEVAVGGHVSSPYKLWVRYEIGGRKRAGYFFKSTVKVL